MMSGHEYIVWINMMSGHGANPIFFNKKIKFGRPEHSLTPRPPMSDNISFLPDPPPPPSKWTSYVYHLLCLYFFCRIIGNSLSQMFFRILQFRSIYVPESLKVEKQHTPRCFLLNFVKFFRAAFRGLCRTLANI